MRVLCVECSPLSLFHLKRNTRRIVPEATVRGCRTPEKALALARTEGCDVLLTEIDLGRAKWEGLFLAERIKSVNPRVNIVFVTVLSEQECAQQVLQLRVSGFVKKPYHLETLAEEFANLRYPVGAESEDSEIRVLLPPQLDDAVGGSVSPGEYVPGLYKEEAKDFFRQCVGEETYYRAMGGDDGRRQHYVAARVFLDQADWKKFTWIEQHGTLDGYPG